MLYEGVKQLIRYVERVMQGLWLAMTLSATLWVLLSYACIRSGKYHLPPTISALELYFYMGAVLMGAASVILRISLLKDNRIRECLLRQTSSSNQTINSNKKLLAKLQQLPHEEQELFRKLMPISGWSLNIYLICWSLNSGIAMLGFVFSLATESYTESVPLVAAAITLNILMFPKLQPLMETAATFLDQENI